MQRNDAFTFPFDNLNDYELINELNEKANDLITENPEIKKLLTKAISNEFVDNMEYKYYSQVQFNDLLNKYKKDINLTIAHVNVRSLNANHDKLAAFQHCCSVKPDVLILSELWSKNLNYYANLFDNYSFFYELPINSKIGGVGLYINKDMRPVVRDDLKIASSCSTYEYKVIEISVGNCKYFVCGFYRHPNTPIKDFKSDFILFLNKTKKRRCFILGDFNICLTKFQ